MWMPFRNFFVALLNAGLEMMFVNKNGIKE